MKRVLTLGIIFLTYIGARAQTSNAENVNATQAKASLAQKMAYHSGSGNIITSSITTKLTPILDLSPDQQQKMNDALYDYFTAKGPYLSLRRTNLPAYNHEQDVLYSQLTTKLGGFLTADQMNRFAASKPANSHTSSILGMIFY